MQNCLGLYIEDNLIKYAKVSKNNENIKVEAFGIKFYDYIENAIKQIVEETYSFKTPISINTTDETYNDIRVFSLLTQTDMKNAVQTEFENICYIKEQNPNIYEQRHIFTNAYKGDDRVKAIHIAVPKTSIEQRKNIFSQYKVNSIVPLSVSIANLATKDKKGNVLIVNIEKDTTITRISNGVVSDIKVLNLGAQDILSNISKKENSYSKAYEICKSTTIYTETDKDLQYEENEYLEDIMPTLFQIVSEIRKNIDESIERIDKVYITGTGSVINNVDIYFQDYLKDVHCEILKPGFINNNSKINIKDYIEVNSAIAIALQGLDKNNRTINFKKESSADKASGFFNTLLNTNVDMSSLKQLDISQKTQEVLGKFDKQVNFFNVILIMLVIVYISGSIIINKSFETKIAEADKSILDTNTRIAQVKEYTNKFNSRTSEYKAIISNIQNLNNSSSEDRRYRNTIPNLLNNIMSVIPKTVHLITIQNTSDSHIIITAKTMETEQMAYFKTKLSTEKILKNVISDTGKWVVETVTEKNLTKEVTYLVVTIEGELP